LIRDHDTNYSAAFDAVFNAEGVDILRTAAPAPQANVYAERWVRTLRRERLDRILIYNQRHLLSTLDEYVTHDNDHRPHQGRHQRPPNADTPGAGRRPHRRPRTPKEDPQRGNQRILARGVSETGLPSGTPSGELIRGALVRSVRRECADRMLIVGESHLTTVLTEYTRHYNGHRPHHSLGQQPPNPAPSRR
jgi:transposase InsO family protein